MFFIRRFLQVCALSTVVWCTAACNNDAPTEAGQASNAAAADADSKPTYVVVTQPYHPPFSIRNSDGSMGGLDVELLQAVAKVEDFNVQVLPHDLSGMLDTLQNGQADIATSIQITPENQNTFLFSQPYLESGYGALVPVNSKIKNIAELQGKTIAVTAGGTVEKQLRSSSLTDKITPTKTLYLALKEVQQGNAAAVYSTEVALKPYLQQNPDYMFVADEKAGQIQFGFALEKRGGPLQGKINKGLSTLRTNGTYQKIINQWLNNAPPPSPAAPAASQIPQ